MSTKRRRAAALHIEHRHHELSIVSNRPAPPQLQRLVSLLDHEDDARKVDQRRPGASVIDRASVGFPSKPADDAAVANARFAAACAARLGRRCVGGVAGRAVDAGGAAVGEARAETPAVGAPVDASSNADSGATDARRRPKTRGGVARRVGFTLMEAGDERVRTHVGVATKLAELRRARPDGLRRPSTSAVVVVVRRRVSGGGGGGRGTARLFLRELRDSSRSRGGGGRAPSLE